MPTKRITLKQVSQAAGVSVQTASHILNTRFQHLYRPETRHKVMQVAQLMGYRPSAAARSMLNQRSHIVGLLVPISAGNWFFQLDVFETLIGINKTLANAGYVTSVIPVNDLLEPSHTSRAFREELLDGVIVMGATPEPLRQLVEQVAPVAVWCDTEVHHDTGCVLRDEHHAGELAAQQLIDLGYRQLVLVTYPKPTDHYSHRGRISGAQAVAKRHNVPLSIIGCLPRIGPEGEQLKQLLRPDTPDTPDTAVLAENSHFAQAVANFAGRERLAVGRDFALAACDYSRERSIVFHDLAHVFIDRAAMGAAAATMLLDALGNNNRMPESILLRGTWQAGDSAPPASKRET